jgi:hypothetical protein
MEFEPMSWDYVAAFLDGEGSIRADCYANKDGSPQRMWQVMWWQSDKAVLDEICEFLVAEGIAASVKLHSVAKTRKGKWGTRQQNRDGYCLRVGGALNIYKVLLKLEKRLRVKREKAAEVLLSLEELMEMALEGELGNSKANQTYAALRLVANGT